MTPWARLVEAASPLSLSLRQAFQDPQRSQEHLLLDMIAAARDSQFGIAHDFARIGSVDAYRELVPIRTYDDFRPSIGRIASGEFGVLTMDPVIAFEETGGSTGGGKLIPYTRRSLEAFRAAVLPWMSDLLRARPRIAEGRAYFAISPVSRTARVTACGIPVGVGSDAAYFGEDLADALADMSVAPAGLASIRDIEDWSLATAAHLVAAEDLSLVSVWSPTFLSRILKSIRTRGGEICALLDAGMEGLAPNASRARLLARLLDAETPDFSLLWPRLDTISAWAGAASEPYAQALRREVPHAYFQGKGLIATEGAVTIPFFSSQHLVPALTSGFFEFVDGEGACHLVHELEDGTTYRIVSTSWGGLFRYDTGDKVECRGFVTAGGAWAETHKGIPTLHFVGRAGITSDLVGEKLTEDFVAIGLANSRSFTALVPSLGPPAGYVLVLEAGGADVGSGLLESVERALCRNPQYAYARRLGQLAKLEALPVADAQERYFCWALHQGRRLSDIKPLALIHDPAQPIRIWPAEFQRLCLYKCFS